MSISLENYISISSQKKISKSVRIISKARFYLPSQNLMTLYYPLVYLIMECRLVLYLLFQPKLYLPLICKSA